MQRGGESIVPVHNRATVNEGQRLVVEEGRRHRTCQAQATGQCAADGNGMRILVRRRREGHAANIARSLCAVGITFDDSRSAAARERVHARDDGFVRVRVGDISARIGILHQDSAGNSDTAGQAEGERTGKRIKVEVTVRPEQDISVRDYHCAVNVGVSSLFELRQRNRTCDAEREATAQSADQRTEVLKGRSLDRHIIAGL